MNKVKAFLIFFPVILILSSCEKDNTFNTKKYDSPQAIYDFPSDKLWKHRVNTIEDARKALLTFSGIETDVFFTDENNSFITGHDAPGDLNLETLFDSIPECTKHYYWIDFKNLNSSNVSAAVSKMNKIIKKYDLRDKIIVESMYPELLAYFKEAGIFTSLWIPDVSVNLIDYFAEKELIDDLEFILGKYQFNAVSAHYNMVPFMEKYMKRYNCHIWTNGLITENDKQQIMSYATKSNIKVILVDYEENFTK